jgi:glutathione S-transferase
MASFVVDTKEARNENLLDQGAARRATIADFQLASMATDWRESEMPLSVFPNIVRWVDTLMRIPAWAEPWPAAKLPQT